MKTVGDQCIKNKRSDIAPLPGSLPQHEENKITSFIIIYIPIVKLLWRFTKITNLLQHPLGGTVLYYYSTALGTCTGRVCHFRMCTDRSVSCCYVAMYINCTLNVYNTMAVTCCMVYRCSPSGLVLYKSYGTDSQAIFITSHCHCVTNVERYTYRGSS